MPTQQAVAAWTEARDVFRRLGDPSEPNEAVRSVAAGLLLLMNRVDDVRRSGDIDDLVPARGRTAGQGHRGVVFAAHCAFDSRAKSRLDYGPQQHPVSYLSPAASLCEAALSAEARSVRAVARPPGMNDPFVTAMFYDWVDLPGCPGRSDAAPLLEEFSDLRVFENRSHVLGRPHAFGGDDALRALEFVSAVVTGSSQALSRAAAVMGPRDESVVRHMEDVVGRMRSHAADAVSAVRSYIACPGAALADRADGAAELLDGGLLADAGIESYPAPRAGIGSGSYALRVRGCVMLTRLMPAARHFADTALSMQRLGRKVRSVVLYGSHAHSARLMGLDPPAHAKELSRLAAYHLARSRRGPRLWA